jgi:hypothetical protein
MATDEKVAAFIKEPPTIEITGGIAVVRYSQGGERAMSVKTLARAVDRAQRALRRHAAGDENIIVDD